MGRREEREKVYGWLSVKILRLSQKAAHCELVDYDDEKLWIPFSVMEDNGRDLTAGDVADLQVEGWFLEKNDIEVDE